MAAPSRQASSSVNVNTTAPQYDLRTTFYEDTRIEYAIFVHRDQTKRWDYSAFELHRALEHGIKASSLLKDLVKEVVPWEGQLRVFVVGSGVSLHSSGTDSILHYTGRVFDASNPANIRVIGGVHTYPPYSQGLPSFCTDLSARWVGRKFDTTVFIPLKPAEN